MAHEIKLGQLCDADQQRDAVHIAVAPVIAAEMLLPGQHIGFVGDDFELVGKATTHIGIVDPFLTHPVGEGRRFFMLLYPQTITSLRHDWTHPAFADGTVQAQAVQPAAVASNSVEESKRWIESFAGKLGQTYVSLMEAAERYVERGDYEYDNSETYKDYWKEFPVFWNHYEIVTGKKVAEEDKDAVPFTCSC